MSDSLFREGGPHQVRRIGSDRYEMRVKIPVDSDGLVGRECPDRACSPGYFKIRPGTGITGGQTEAYCPYCRHAATPHGFTTRAQNDYAIGVMKNEATQGLNRIFQDALGLGPSRRRKIGDGLFSIEISSTPLRTPPILPPQEEVLRRDVTCPHCELEHAVFGLATWCPDCGADIFLSHVEQEIAVIRKMLAAVTSRRTELGARVAARDVENALEDTVSVFEAVLKIVFRRFLATQGKTPVEIDELLARKVRASFQSVLAAEALFRDALSFELLGDLEPEDRSAIVQTFEKRHPIAHNLGVIDRKYLERMRSGVGQGRDVRVSTTEVERALDISWQILSRAYRARDDHNSDTQSTPIA